MNKDETCYNCNLYVNCKKDSARKHCSRWIGTNDIYKCGLCGSTNFEIELNCKLDEVSDIGSSAFHIIRCAKCKDEIHEFYDN